MNTEDKYTKANMIDFGKLCSDNPQMNVDYLYGQWIVPKSVVLNLNKVIVKGDFCSCATPMGVRWINNSCVCNSCDRLLAKNYR